MEHVYEFDSKRVNQPMEVMVSIETLHDLQSLTAYTSLVFLVPCTDSFLNSDASFGCSVVST